MVRSLSVKRTNPSTHQAKLYIWHPLIRWVHLFLISVFILNYYILEAGSNIHQWLGYGALSVVIVRIVWSFYTSGYGSLKLIRMTPAGFREHLAHVRARHIPADSGHNPIGWLFVLGCWLLFMALAVSGFLFEEIDRFFGNSTLEWLHGLFADTLLVLVIIHIAAVVLVGRLGRVQLIRAMITGRRDPN